MYRICFKTIFLKLIKLFRLFVFSEIGFNGGKYSIKKIYFYRKKPIFDDRRQSVDKIWQKEVYDIALYFINEKTNNIIDIGCGGGQKIYQISLKYRSNIIGIDFGQNISYCRKTYINNIRWVDHNIDSKTDLVLNLTGSSVFICADVIEHIRHPSLLLTKIKRNMKKGDILIMSTPERDLVRGKYHIGPPTNTHHIREWNTREFTQFLLVHNLRAKKVTTAENNDYDKKVNSQVHVIEYL